MNIKQTLKKIAPYKFKVLALAGLMGGLTACKDSYIEPDAPTSKQQVNTSEAPINNPQNEDDLFLSHLGYNIDDAKIYLMGFNENTITFQTENNKVTQATTYSNEEYSGEGIDYSEPISQGTRVTNTLNSDKYTAAFKDGNGYKYWLSGDGLDYYDPFARWFIRNVSPKKFNDKFAHMSKQELKDFIEENSETTVSDTSKLTWVEVEHGCNYIKSKGAQAGLKNADFGFVTGDKTDPIKEERDSLHHYPYIGGLERQKQPTPTDECSFYGTAYAVLDDGFYVTNGGNATTTSRIVSTKPGAASFYHGNTGDTLKMPFEGYYNITIIATNGQLETIIEESSFDAKYNKYKHFSNSSSSSEAQKDSNTGFDCIFTESDFLVKGFYGIQSGTPTGLDIVYANSPIRKAPSSNDCPVAEAVITGSKTNEYSTSHASIPCEHDTIKTCTLNFVFGGINQNQR